MSDPVEHFLYVDFILAENRIQCSKDRSFCCRLDFVYVNSNVER